VCDTVAGVADVLAVGYRTGQADFRRYIGQAPTRISSYCLRATFEREPWCRCQSRVESAVDVDRGKFSVLGDGIPRQFGLLAGEISAFSIRLRPDRAVLQE
jgi:hypothetical protein